MITTYILTIGVAIVVTLSFMKKSRKVLWAGYITCILVVIGVFIWVLELANIIPRF